MTLAGSVLDPHDLRVMSSPANTEEVSQAILQSVLMEWQLCKSCVCFHLSVAVFVHSVRKRIVGFPVPPGERAQG